MKIDRHNYEEFFLLYIDNELNVEQKKQVELFLQENTDLEEEFIMLQQSKLVADDSIVFEGKDMLMKKETSVNLDNYEQWLLLYTDDELTQEERTAIEKFAATYPHVQKELELFLQTKLQPEKIVFTDKESLYRKEEKVEVITLQWWKIAVAAVLIIAAGIGVYSLINKNAGPVGPEKSISSSGKTTPVKENSVVTKTDNTKKETDQPTLPEVNNKVENKIAEINSAEKNRKENKIENDLTKQQGDHNLIANVDQQIPAQIEKTKNKLVDLNFNSGNSSQSLITNTVALKPPKQIINDTSVTKRIPQTPESMYAGNTENKKLRGFFRKATRFIERTTNFNPANDDDKVLIGGLAVNLK